MRRWGTTNGGIPRIACLPCGTYIQIARSRIAVRKRAKLNQAIILFRAGRSTRDVMAVLNVANKTANNWRRIALKDYKALCGCGQEAGHRGWCSFRLKESPKRRAFLMRWHKRASGHVETATIVSPVPPFCSARLDAHASFAIRRYQIVNDDAHTDESFSRRMVALWKSRRDTGCPMCGSVRQYASDECRRCISLRLIIERAELVIAATIGALIYEANAPRRALMESLRTNQNLSPSQRLELLLRGINGNERNIDAQN